MCQEILECRGLIYIKNVWSTKKYKILSISFTWGSQPGTGWKENVENVNKVEISNEDENNKEIFESYDDEK